MCGAWLRKNVPQLCPDGSLFLTMYLADGRRSHRKAEFEQLSMDARRTPKNVLNAHPSDQGPQIPTDLWSATQVPRFPPPIATKSGTMPAHQRLWPNDLDRLEDRRETNDTVG